MKTEYEVRVLEINEQEIQKKLKELGATFKAKYFQKRYVYDLKPAQKGKWLRLRTNGEKTTLTFKQIEKDTIDGTKEIEIEVDNFETTNELLETLGYFAKRQEENKRITYELDQVEIDIDTWPMIPTYMEIEGKSKEQVNQVLQKLSLQNKEITCKGVKDIYSQYGIDIDLDIYKVLKF